MATNNNASNEGELLTVSEVARILRVDDTTVRRWVKSGVLHAITLPKDENGTRNTYRIHRSQLQKVFDSSAVTQ